MVLTIRHSTIRLAKKHERLQRHLLGSGGEFGMIWNEALSRIKQLEDMEDTQSLLDDEVRE